MEASVGASASAVPVGSLRGVRWWNVLGRHLRRVFAWAEVCLLSRAAGRVRSQVGLLPVDSERHKLHMFA